MDSKKTDKTDPVNLEDLEKRIKEKVEALEKEMINGIYQRCVGCGSLILPPEGWKTVLNTRRDSDVHVKVTKREYWHSMCWYEYTHHVGAEPY